MSIYNPYRNYDKGMDDSYMGLEPQMPNSSQYMEGYEYSESLLDVIVKTQMDGQYSLNEIQETQQDDAKNRVYQLYQLFKGGEKQ